MPAEFQRAMDCILSDFPQVHAFIDDILVVTKGTEIDHIATVEKILKKLDKENMSLKLTKCNFAQRECEWLGHKTTHGHHTIGAENGMLKYFYFQTILTDKQLTITKRGSRSVSSSRVDGRF